MSAGLILRPRRRIDNRHRVFSPVIRLPFAEFFVPTGKHDYSTGIPPLCNFKVEAEAAHWLAWQLNTGIKSYIVRQRMMRVFVGRKELMERNDESS